MNHYPSFVYFVYTKTQPHILFLNVGFCFFVSFFFFFFFFAKYRNLRIRLDSNGAHTVQL